MLKFIISSLKCKSIFIYSVVFLFLYQPLTVQNTIRGAVTDKKTGKPIPGVNVYLANTTIGASTNADGVYKLGDIPNGLYQLVFSMVSYKKKIINFKMEHSSSLKINSALQPKVFQLREMSITASNKQWEKDYRQFRKEFIGETHFAKKTKVLNKTVLRFQKDAENGDLLAQSKQPLKIKNRALGYNIYAELNSFRWSKNGTSGSYKIYPYFTEMEPRNEQQKQRWQKNRKGAYKASLRNFMISLYEENMDETNFKIPKQYKLIELSEKESKFNLINHAGIPQNLIDILKGFRLTDKMGVIYGSDYSVIVPGSKNGIFFIDNTGNLLNPLSLKIGGHWAEARLANQLPFNYHPVGN